LGDDTEWQTICEKLKAAHRSQASVKEFAASLGLNNKITGYAYHTVPVAIYAWLRHPNDFRLALSSALDCGGDTDTVGAIVGALAGANVGTAGIPSEWTQRMVDWPRSVSLLRKLAHELALPPGEGKSVGYFWPGVIPRNIFFLVVVLLHGFRRLLPPYS